MIGFHFIGDSMSLFSLKATWQKVTAIVGALLIIGSVVGATIKVDTRYAKRVEMYSVSNEINLVGIRLDQKIIQDRIDSYQSRIWKIEDRYRGKPMPQDAIEAIRQYQKEIEKLKRQLKKG